MFKRNRSATGKRKRPKRKIPNLKIEELLLPASKLKFTTEQLQNLNFIFHQRLNEDKISRETGNSILLARSVTERLIQRLICGVGTADPKFSSKYLIHLHDPADKTAQLQYLIRLDTLSTPTLYKNDAAPKYSIIENEPEFPKGYGRIRMFSSLFKVWGEYANAQGFLRRDRIQTRYVELLAAVAACEGPNSPANLDESVLCASPGKILDACTLHNILKTPPEGHVYYGTNGTSPRFPDPRDFRLAIVDEPAGIRLRIEFLSPALSSICMDVRLLIGVETQAWPASTDFPARIPLGHSDALLYQNAAHTGLYLVGYGVQSSGWQMRFPSAEDTILKNYSTNSTISNILKVTEDFINEIYDESLRHQKYQYNYRILNSYIFKTALFFELEKDFNSPTTILLNWSPQTLSMHVLKILDNLIVSLRLQKQPNYFFAGANLLANPGHLCEDDYIYEAKRVLAHIIKLYDLSCMSTMGNVEFDKMVLGQDLEMLLLCKWKELIDSLLPPTATRGRRFCFAGTKTRREVAYTQYTSRQLEYIALLLKAALNAKKCVIQPIDETWGEHAPGKKQDDSTTEDIIYILLTIIEQAKQHYLLRNADNKVKQKLATHFEPTILKLAELVRKTNESVTDDLDFVKIILKWLYRALDQNKRLLAPILRPALNILFISSHGNSWFLESIKKRAESDELVAIGAFSTLVNEGKITPAAGLVDSVNKNWIWAKDMLDIIRVENLRLVFVDGRGKNGRHVMSVPNSGADLKSPKIFDEVSISTLPKKSYFCTMMNNGPDSAEYKTPWHCILRDSSPMTKILAHVHRNGDHRCSGDIMQTLLSMQKLNILHDVTAILPEEDRIQLLDYIQKLSSDKKKNTVRRKAQTLPSFNKYSATMIPTDYSVDSYQKYTQRGDAKAKMSQSKEEMALHKFDLNKASLMQSCRDARIKDDNSISYDNGNIRSLIRSKESFRT